MKRLLAIVLTVAAVLLLPLAPAGAAPVPVLQLDGTGYGHGVGLSQWGARYLASTGASTSQILGTFYPGVRLGEATAAIHVAVYTPGSSVTTVSFPNGGEVRSALQGKQAPGFPVRVGRGGQIRILWNGAYRVTPLVSGQSAAHATSYQEDPCLLGVICATTTTTRPGTTTTTPPSQTGTVASSSQPVVAVPNGGGTTNVDGRGRAYRGVVEATGGGALRLVNIVNVEDYLRGMAEVPGSWPAAAVQAQTIAARTYALRASSGGKEICDDARCQVYVGATAESPGQNAAVAATTKKVLAYKGALAAAVYSADAGGFTANTFEGFGTPDGVYPYLKNVKYTTDNPLPWHLTVALTDLGARFGYPGTVTGARISQAGPSGRALQVELQGSAGPKAIDGHQFARSLGLRSTRFTAKAENGIASALPAPTAEPLQELPEQAAAVAVRPLKLLPEDVALDPLTADDNGAIAPPHVPEALDPRRHPVTLLAVLLLALVIGAEIPVLMASGGTGVRTSRRWKALRQRR